MRHHGFWQSERGFTLAEVMVTIIIMGILAAVAMSFWWPLVEGRRVDSATNQMVSDLRRAHTSATNRLVDHEVHLTANSPTYEIRNDLDDNGTIECPNANGDCELETRTLLGLEGNDVDSPEINTTLTIVFEADGSASATPAPPEGSPITFGVHSPEADADPCHAIEINTITSRVQVLRDAC